jgi:WD40 repeat protein
VFAQVRSFLSGPPGTFLLRGDPGTGKTAVAARLAQASCGRAATDGLEAHLAVAEGTISAAGFCRAGETTVTGLIQRLSRQLENSVEGFSDALQSALAPEIKVGNVHVEAHDVTGDVTGVRIVLNGLSDERAFRAGLAEPLRQLRELGAAQQIVLLVDAVDEAVTAGEVNAFSRLLGTLDDVHLIVTSRPDGRVLADLRDAERKVDLRADAPPGDHDVRDYISNRLQGRGPEGVIAALADRIEVEAAGNFLYVFYVTATLIESGSIAGMDEETARELTLPTGGLAGVYEDFLDRQIAGDETRWQADLRPILAPLCVALGDGLTTAQLRSIASHLTSRDFLLSKARDVTRRIGQFLDGARPDGPFRAYHPSFTRFLTDPEKNPNWPIDITEANNAVLQALSPAAPEGPYGAADWSAADPYAKKYFAIHAAISGRLDDFLVDAGYLLAADPGQLLAVLSSASRATGKLIARVLRRAAHQFQTCSREEAASYLEIQARQSALDTLAGQIAQLHLARAWVTPWVQWRRPQQRLRLAPDQDITALTIVVFRDECVAVLATKSGQLQILRITDGSHARDPLIIKDARLASTEITILAAGEVKEQPVVLTGDSDGWVKAWNLMGDPTEQLFQCKHERSICALALTEIYGIPVVISADQFNARLWRWSDGTLIAPDVTPSLIRAIAITHYNKVPIVAYNYDRYVKFRAFPGPTRSIDNEEVSRSFWGGYYAIGSPVHDHDVTALAALEVADRTIMISGDGHGYVWAWNIVDARKKAEIYPIGRHLTSNAFEEWGNPISALAVAEVNGREIAASAGGGKIKVWDLARSRQIGYLPGAHTNEIKTLAITDLDGGIVVVSCADEAVHVWDLDESESPDQRGMITALTFANLDGTEVLLAGDLRGRVQVLQVTDGCPVAPAFCGHSGEVTAITAGRIGNKLLVLSGSMDGTVQIWDPANAMRAGKPYDRHRTGVSSVAATQVGGRLIAASGDSGGMVRIWDVARRHRIGRPIDLGSKVPLGGVAFAELGQRPVIVTATNTMNPSLVQVWDLSSRITVGNAATLGDFFSTVTTVQLDTQLLVVFSSYDGVVRVRSFTDGKVEADLHGSQPGWYRGLAATTWDGHLIVLAGSRDNGVIDIWDVGTGTHRRIDIGSAIYSLAAGPRRTLAVGTSDGIAMIKFRYDIST